VSKGLIEQENEMELSGPRLWLLRAMYLTLVIGQAATIWPGILFPSYRTADSHAVVSAFLGALSLLALLGLRYPIKMLPLLMFELAWKAIWALAFAIPAWLRGGLDDYAIGVTFAVGFGLIVTPVVLPWRYMMQQFLFTRADTFSMR
jgi:hypothetical protein